MRMNETPRRIDKTRVLIRSGRDGTTRLPTVMVEIRAIANAKSGAKYHCAATELDLLMKANMVTSSA
jgi:hypothetical protein